MAEHPHDIPLTRDEQLVLDTVAAQDEALDAIDISSLTRVPVDRVLAAITTLVERNYVERAEPEPVHQRVSPTQAHGPLQPVS